MDNGWIGVDLDGTLAEYTTWQGVEYIGAPVPKMVERVKKWLSEGKDVRIMTARVSPVAIKLNCGMVNVGTKREVYGPIESWCKKHLGIILPITHEKDMGMLELWDDRAVQVIPNTGERVDEPLKWTEIASEDVFNYDSNSNSYCIIPAPTSLEHLVSWQHQGYHHSPMCTPHIAHPGCCDRWPKGEPDGTK